MGFLQNVTCFYYYHDVHVVFSVGAWGNRVHVADAERHAENPHGSAQNKPLSRPRFFPG